MFCFVLSRPCAACRLICSLGTGRDSYLKNTFCSKLAEVGFLPPSSDVLVCVL